MRGIYDDFQGHWLPIEAEIDDALATATVAIDANVLLNLYRYNTQTASDLLSVLAKMGDRLIVPHQVLVEFWRHRQGSANNPTAATDAAAGALAKNLRSITDALVNWGKQVGYDGEPVDSMIADATQFLEAQIARVREVQPGGGSGGNDGLLRQLEVLLAGRVTDKPSAELYESWIVEGNRRAANEIPPGFKDAHKVNSELPEGAAGDFLVWSEAAQESGSRQSDLVFVTGDEKEDWWWRERSVLLGPRPELAVEYHESCGKRLFMVRPRDLLQRSGALDVPVAPESLADVDRASHRLDLAKAQWNLIALEELLDRLAQQAMVQASVIRRAAELGGRISRDEVFALGGYSDDRMLRGFTRPTRRITEDLQREGLLDRGVSPILVALYPDGVRASFFRVPHEVTNLYEELMEIYEDGNEGSDE